MLITKIYKLIDPTSLNVKYIGKTTQKLNIRLNHHISKAKSNPNISKKNIWLMSLINNNQKPLIELIEICEGDLWIEREKYWISYYKNLLNQTSGGEDFIIKQGNTPWNKGGSKYTPETIEKMKEAKKLYPHSEEGKKAISESNKRRFNSGELTTFQLHTPEVKSKTKEILSKKTIEYDLEGNFVKIWNSATDAEKFYNIFGVSECCRGIIKSSGNRIFRYFEENYPMKIEVDLDIITRTVLMIDNNMNIIKQFKNVKEAANWIFDNLNTEKRKLKKIDSLIMSLRSILRKECFYRGYYWKWGSHPKKTTN